MGVLHGFVDGHGRLLDELDPVQPFHVHVAFVAGHEEAHRIALGRVDALAVLIERNHRVIERLGDRDAAIHARPVGAFGKEPLRTVTRLSHRNGAMRGVYHRAGPPDPASGRPDGRLRPDPVAYCALRS
jgi:hypothetical protein